MNSKPILYDLGVSLGAMSLWLTPFSATRLVGYITSIVFASDAYYRGIVLLQKMRRNDEKEAILYEAETDFYEQLLGSQIEGYLETKAIEIETNTIKRLIPLIQQKTQLEKQLQDVSPIHPEMFNEDKVNAAKKAVNDAFVQPETASDRSSQITEEAIREKFPETMDATCWKAILKALQDGASKSEIVKDVLQCQSNIGMAYLELLKRKFLD